MPAVFGIVEDPDGFEYHGYLFDKWCDSVDAAYDNLISDQGKFDALDAGDQAPPRPDLHRD